MYSIELTKEGNKVANKLLHYEDMQLDLDFYGDDYLLDTTMTKWTLGNDCLLIMSGLLDDEECLLDSMSLEGAIDAFSMRVVKFFDVRGVDIPYDDEEGNLFEKLEEVFRGFMDDGLLIAKEIDERLFVELPPL